MCATEETQGFYFGLFWAIYMSSNTLGCYLGSVLINKFTGPVFYMLNGVAMVIVALLFLSIREPKTIE